MMEAMERAGAVRLNSREIDELTRHAIIQVGDDKHDAPAKEFLGQDAPCWRAARGDPCRRTPSCCSAKPTNRTRSWRSSR
jgi:hypothetical protein